jgi:hypothetical protein
MLDTMQHMMLEPQLNILQESGLIRLAATQPELEYLFRHALIQDAVYASLLKNNRRSLHLAIGEILESARADRLAEEAALLAHHFYLAGDARALRYLTMAGDEAARKYANGESVVHYGRAIELSRRGGALPMGVSLLDLYLRRGRALELQSQHAEALANYEQMEMAARTPGNEPMRLPALIARASIYALPTPLFDESRAMSLVGQALELAQQLGDEAAQAKIFWTAMVTSRTLSRLDEALAYGERSLAIARRLGGHEQLALTLNDLSEQYTFVGRPADARRALAEAAPLWRELDNLPMVTDNLGKSAALDVWTGNYRSAIEMSEEAYQISARTGNTWGRAFSAMFAGTAYLEGGEPGRAIAEMEGCLEASAAAGFFAPGVVTRAKLARTYGELGCTEKAIGLATRAVADTGAMYGLFGPGALGSLAHLYLLTGQTAAAEAIFESHPDGLATAASNPLFNTWFPLAHAEWLLTQRMYADAQKTGEAIMERLRAYGIWNGRLSTMRFLARLQAAQRQWDAAAAALRETLAAADSIGAQWNSWQIMAELSLVEQERGQRAEAQALRAQAHRRVSAMAQRIDDPDVRAAWLGTAQVGQLAEDG